MSRRSRRPFALVALVMVAQLLAPSVGGVAGAQDGWTISADDEAAYVASINAARADEGLSPLVVDPNMTAAARDWSIWMVEHNSLQHAEEIATGAPTDWMKVGENVGRGPAVPVVWDAFLASPAHKANVLDPVYSLVGVGVVRTADGRHYTTHRFASVVTGLGADPPPSPTPAPPPAGESAPAAPDLLAFADLEPVPPIAEPDRLAVTMTLLVEAGR